MRMDTTISNYLAQANAVARQQADPYCRKLEAAFEWRMRKAYQNVFGIFRKIESEGYDHWCFENSIPTDEGDREQRSWPELR